jgi:hypothetical protein
VKEFGQLQRWALTQRALGNHWLAGPADPTDNEPWRALAETIWSLDESDD